MVRIYLTNLEKYNSGELSGEWITLPKCEEELSEDLKRVLDGSEEYFLTDWEHETETELVSISEYCNIFTLNSELEKVEDLDEHDLKRVGFLIEDGIVSNVEEALEKYDDVIIYEDSNMTDIAEEYVMNTVDLDSISDIIRNNINYSHVAADLEADGCYYELNNDIYYYAG